MVIPTIRSLNAKFARNMDVTVRRRLLKQIVISTVMLATMHCEHKTMITDENVTLTDSKRNTSVSLSIQLWLPKQGSDPLFSSFLALGVVKDQWFGYKMLDPAVDVITVLC